METEGNGHVEKVGERVVGEKDLKYEIEEVKFGSLKRLLIDKGR